MLARRILITFVSGVIATASLAGNLSQVRQQINDSYQYDFIDLRQELDIMRFNLRGVRPSEPDFVLPNDGLDYLRQHPLLSLEGEQFKPTLIEHQTTPQRQHERFALSYLGIPLRGSDIRIHRSLDGLDGPIHSVNGQSIQPSPLLVSFSSQWQSDASLNEALLTEEELIGIVARQLELPASNLRVNSSLLEWTNSSPHLLHSIDLTIAGGNARIHVELNPLTGELVRLDNRIHLHKPLAIWERQ